MRSSLRSYLADAEEEVGSLEWIDGRRNDAAGCSTRCITELEL
jgi:hypothetical protein